MRFSTVALLAIAVGVVVASPVPDVVKTVGGAVKTVDDKSGVTAIEDEVNTASGGAVDKLEGKLGVTYAEETLGLERRQGDIQTIGKGVSTIEKGAGITATEDFLDKESGGALTAAEGALGVTTVDKAIDAE